MEDRFAVGDIIRMKKPHPCGSHEWEILRVGADFRLKWLKKIQKKYEKRLERNRTL